jgi:hypothetical protein
MEQRPDLPDDIESLRAMVIQLQGELHCLKRQTVHLQEQIRLLLHKRFGAQSEKYPAGQADLVNEAEVYAEESVVPLAEATESPVRMTASSIPPASRGRKALPKEFPRVDIIHELRNHNVTVRKAMLGSSLAKKFPNSWTSSPPRSRFCGIYALWVHP